MQITIGSEWLVQVAAAILSLAFSYIPGLRVWYGGKGEEFKSLFMAGLLLLVVGVMFGLGCAGWIETNIACSSMGVRDAIVVFVMAVAVNQGFYKISPQPRDVKNAKELR
jgi:hypothetical protein